MKNIEKYLDKLKKEAKEYGTIDCLIHHLRVNNDDCKEGNCGECCAESLEWLNEEEG